MNVWTNHGAIDECIVYGITVTTPQQPITSVQLKIIDWYNRDIEHSDETKIAEKQIDDKDKIISFYIRSSPSCHYVPSGIVDNFKNIKVLVIAFTGLQIITQADLKPMKNLQNLYIDNNKLTSLADDLFIFNPSIEYINLAQNKISSIGLNTFEPLTGLQELSILGNPCFAFRSVSLTEVEKLKTQLKINCAPVDSNLF